MVETTVQIYARSTGVDALRTLVRGDGKVKISSEIVRKEDDQIDFLIVGALGDVENFVELVSTIKGNYLNFPEKRSSLADLKVSEENVRAITIEEAKLFTNTQHPKITRYTRWYLWQNVASGDLLKREVIEIALDSDSYNEFREKYWGLVEDGVVQKQWFRKFIDGRFLAYRQMIYDILEPKKLDEESTA